MTIDEFSAVISNYSEEDVLNALSMRDSVAQMQTDIESLKVIAGNREQPIPTEELDEQEVFTDYLASFNHIERKDK